MSCAPSSEEAEEESTPAATSESTYAPSVWRNGADAFPITLKISSDFSGSEKTAIRNMADEWEDATDDDIQFFSTTDTTSEKSTNNLDSFSDGTMGVYKHTDWNDDLPSSALAVTQIYGTRKNVGKNSEYIRIEHADIFVNYDDFTFSTNGDSGYDLQTVVLHEMGHFLGLYHFSGDREDSIMYPYIGQFDSNREPKQEDADNIADKYEADSAVMGALSINTDSGDSEPITMILELRADGECVHKINGIIQKRHKR